MYGRRRHIEDFSQLAITMQMLMINVFLMLSWWKLRHPHIHILVPICLLYVRLGLFHIQVYKPEPYSTSQSPSIWDIFIEHLDIFSWYLIYDPSVSAFSPIIGGDDFDGINKLLVWILHCVITTILLIFLKYYSR